MKFDIIIQAGQSNAEGCGVGPVEKEYISTDKVWQLDAPKKVTALPNGMDIVYLDEPFILKVAEECEGENGKVGNFGLTFSEEYIKAGMLEEKNGELEQKIDELGSVKSVVEIAEEELDLVQPNAVAIQGEP